MDVDKNDDWLRELVDDAREENLAHTPSFQQLWSAAERHSAERNRTWTSLAPRYAVVAFTALAVITAVFWNSSEAPQNRRAECDLAGLDSVLLTYWQAPSDVLLEPLSPAPIGQIQ